MKKEMLVLVLASVFGLSALSVVQSQDVVQKRVRARIESPPVPEVVLPRPKPAGWTPPVVKEAKVPIGPVLDVQVNVEDPAWIVFQRPLILAEQDRRIASHPGNNRYVLQKEAVSKKLDEVVAASFVIAANSEKDSLKILQAMEFWRTNRIDAEGCIVPLK